MSVLPTLLMASACALGASSAAHAGEREILLAPGALPGDEAGIGIALDAAFVVSGAAGENAAAGAAYVHGCGSATCTTPQRLAPSDLAAGDRFGAAVALSGNLLAVTAPGAQPGAVYVFALTGGSWVQQARIAPPAATGEHFAAALALAGDTLVVGADRADARAGAVYVFTLGGTVWGQRARISAADAHAGDGFGRAVAIDAGTILVGAPLAPAASAGSFARGAAYAFVGSGATWVQQGKLVPASLADGDLFGQSVSLKGERAAIGAPMAQSRAGSAYVFERSAGAWSEQARVLPGIAAAGDRFGWSVAIDASRLLVGAPYAYASCGQATLFLESAAGWSGSIEAAIAAPLPETLAGWAVALDGQRFAVSAPGYALGDDHRGAVYRFDAGDFVFADGFEQSAIALACE